MPSAIASSLVWTISRAPTALRHLIAELDHLAELVGGVDVQQRERNRPGIERLLRQPQHAPTSPCRSSRASPGRSNSADHLAHDVDALGLERAQVVEAGRYVIQSSGKVIIGINKKARGMSRAFDLLRVVGSD